MAITDTQKVDYLFKKVGYGISKTDTSSVKTPAQETIASPLVIRGDTIWQQSSSIPATKPASSSGVVTVYSDATTNTVQCTADATASTSRTWKTGLTNWIDSSFGSTYAVSVYLDSTGSSTPQTTGTQLFPDGTGNSDEWFFDYSSGVLNFIGSSLPSVTFTSKSIFIVGARYTGVTGIGNINANTIIGTIATANVTLYSNVNSTTANYNYNLLLGNVASGNTQIYDNASYTLNALTGNLAVGNISAAQFNGNLLGTVLTPNQSLITTVGNLTNLSVVGGVTNYGNVTTAGNVITTGGIFWPNGNPYGSGTFYSNANVSALLSGISSNISTTGNLSAGNLTVTSNVTTGNLNVTKVTVTGNLSAGNVLGTFYGNVHADRITSIDGNLWLQPLPGNLVVIDTTTALLLPQGNIVQRPSTAIPGSIRYNTDTLSIEWWNGAVWFPITNSIQSQQFTGNGVATTFGLNFPADTNSLIVNINGTMQIPNFAYTVADSAITFTEAPLSTDRVDVRFIAVPLIDVLGNGVVGNSFTLGNTSTYIPPQALGPGDSPTFQNITINGTINGANIVGGSSSYGNSNVAAYLQSGSLTGNVIYGNILPAANVTYSLGSSQYQWKDLWVSNSTIYIGGVAIKANAQGNTLTINNNLIGGQIKYSKQSTAPTGPNIGDQWYDTDTDVLYEYINDGTTSYWVDITGPFGVAGIEGNIGPQGPTGNDGTSVIIIGSVTYANALPQWGNLTYGEGFIVQNTGNLFVYDGSNFQDVGQIKGPKGDTGATGPQGIQGIQGNTGPAGTNGINGTNGTNYLNFGNITANANLNLVTGTLNFISGLGVKIDISDANDTANVYLDPNGNINVYSVTSRFAENVITGNVPSSYTPDWAAGTIHNYTAIQNFTLNAPINMPVGASMTIVVTQDSNGSRAMTANSYYKFASNIKTLSTGANSVDMMNFVRTGANTYLTVLTKGYA